ncbi:MAG: hypothetical protein R2845_00200 [Thermomicrobiales bacterium]
MARRRRKLLMPRTRLRAERIGRYAGIDRTLEGRLAAEHGGIYATHQRYNDLGAEQAWLETIEIGRKAGIPVHVSHAGVDEMTARIMRELDDEIDLTFESYLYPAGCTDLTLMLPIWASAGGPKAILSSALHSRTSARKWWLTCKPDWSTTREPYASSLPITPASDSSARKSAMWLKQLGIEPGEFAMRMIEEGLRIASWSTCADGMMPAPTP